MKQQFEIGDIVEESFGKVGKIIKVRNDGVVCEYDDGNGYKYASYINTEYIQLTIIGHNTHPNL